MKTLLRVYKLAKPYYKYIAVSSVALLLITGINLVTPGIMQNLIKLLETGGNANEMMGKVIYLATALVTAYILQSLFKYFYSYYGHKSAWTFVSDIRCRVYDHLQTMPVSFYTDKQTGRLMSRIIQDTSKLESMMSHSVPDLISSGLTFIGVAVILFLNNWKLALLTCIPLPFLVVGIPILKRIREQHREAQKKIANLNALLQDNIQGIREIQIFNREEAESARVKRSSEKHAFAVLKAFWYSSAFYPLISFFMSVGNVIVLFFGGFLAIKFDMTISDVTGFFMYLSMFYAPISSFARILEDLQRGIVGGERILEILDTEPEIKDKKNAIDIPIGEGLLEFKNVSFGYRKDIPVLKNISFVAEPKKMYAIVGATGVGKTTLASLIPRFYDPSGGEILLNGYNIKDITLKSLRNNISMVLQDVFLFHGTIKDNIVFGNPNATEEQIINAAKTACIYDFIKGLPEGFNTMVGERGMKLSGGQKQRISIARSVLCKSSVLILDEATSAVDTETETYIKQAIKKIAGSRTMLIIAHRLSTVKAADEIIVLNEGKVAETGTHTELYKKGGIYKKLVDLQDIKD